MIPSNGMFDAASNTSRYARCPPSRSHLTFTCRRRLHSSIQHGCRCYLPLSHITRASKNHESADGYELQLQDVADSGAAASLAEQPANAIGHASEADQGWSSLRNSRRILLHTIGCAVVAPAATAATAGADIAYTPSTMAASTAAAPHQAAAASATAGNPSVGLTGKYIQFFRISVVLFEEDTVSHPSTIDKQGVNGGI